MHLRTRYAMSRAHVRTTMQHDALTQYGLRFVCGRASLLSRGELFNLGRAGCNPLLLRGGRYTRLEVEKPFFYPFSEQYWLPTSATSLPVALFPIMETPKKSSIGMALSWYAPTYRPTLLVPDQDRLGASDSG
eukprot:2520211-Rhodomonas_salina.7